MNPIVAVAADTAALVFLSMRCGAVDIGLLPVVVLLWIGEGVRVAVHCSVTRHLVFGFDRGVMHFTK